MKPDLPPVGSPGVYIINLKKTWEKLLLAARAIVAIENPADVCVISSRNTGQVRRGGQSRLTVHTVKAGHRRRCSGVGSVRQKAGWVFASTLRTSVL